MYKYLIIISSLKVHDNDIYDKIEPVIKSVGESWWYQIFQTWIISTKIELKVLTELLTNLTKEFDPRILILQLPDTPMEANGLLPEEAWTHLKKHKIIK